MKEDYFNVSMNKIGFRILNLRDISITEMFDEVVEIERDLDEFKEECLKKIKFEENLTKHNSR